MVMKICTFRDGSSFPARASKRVVFPEDGGPNNKHILYPSIANFFQYPQKTFCLLLTLN